MRIAVIGLVACVLAGAAWPAKVVTPVEARAQSRKAVETLITLEQTLADQYFHIGEFPAAIRVLDRLIVLEPDNSEHYATAAWLTWSNGDLAKAEDYYRAMIAANPSDVTAYFTVGFFYYHSLRRPADALPWLEKAVELGLPSPQRHTYGYALEQAGRLQDALAFWQRVLADDPNDAPAKREVEKLTKATS